MVTTLGPYTVADLLRMREETDDRLELIDGEVFVVPSPDVDHRGISVRLVHHFFLQVELRGIGRVFHAPMDLRFTELRDVQLDLIVVLAADGATLVRPRIEGVPTLVVEIVSPSSRVHDRQRKRALYADVGVPEYLLVEPLSRSVTSLSEPSGGDYRAETVSNEGDTFRSATIPGLEIAVADLFPPSLGSG
ncbi:MAG: Uma2 family endonuclease [Chloroflexia bacterium]|nr:Uma2 family endonuclease [Chloroflexia bacterium]